MSEPLSPSPSEVEDGVNGKKRKYCGLGSSSSSSVSCSSSHLRLSSLFSAYSSSSSLHPGRSLKILTQPELQHRARYQTEGSRGSVKDREGSGFPTLQLKGYTGPERQLSLEVFIGSDTGRPVYPHVYYQACRVAGKNSTPSSETRQEGTDVILMDMEAEKDFILRCDCVGILKERYSDIENKIPSQKQRTNWKKKSTKCRMVFRVEIPEEDGSKETLQVVSDPISCSQQPGTPEILKMSSDCSGLSGGGELWMIGKNFLKDAVVVFQENLSSSEAFHRTPWTQTIPPDKDFFNNSHMIVTIPAFDMGSGVELSSPISRTMTGSSCIISSSSTSSFEVSVFVKCGEKTSDSHSFTYRQGSSDSYPQKDTASSGSSSPKCVSPVRSSRNSTTTNSRITILEPVESRYLTKEEIDYCEDTVFDPEKTQEEAQGSSYLYRHPPIPEESNSVTFSNTVTNTTTTNNNNPGEEETTNEHQQRVTTFSNLFQKSDASVPQTTNVASIPIGESPGVMVIPTISSDTLKAAQKELLKSGGEVESKIMVNGNSNGTHLANTSQEFLGTNIESKSGTNAAPIYIQGTESDNATISIKLPNSIISNSEKFENVMNTINKALLQPDPSLKSIDSNLARVDISRNSNQVAPVPVLSDSMPTAPLQSNALPPTSNNNNSTPKNNNSTTNTTISNTNNTTASNGSCNSGNGSCNSGNGSCNTGNASVTAIVPEPSELHPKKQKINDVISASQPNSAWLETWNTSTTASTAAPVGKEALPKGPTPMDTSPFFSTAEASEAVSSWSEPGPSPNTVDKSQISLSNIIPELKSNSSSAAVVAAENWNSVKVEAENWSKTAPTAWSSNVGAASATSTESWHSPSATAAVVSQNWPAQPPNSTPKNWNEAAGQSESSWHDASGAAVVVNGSEELVIATASNPSTGSAEVVWAKTTNDAPSSNTEAPTAQAPWPEKADDQQQHEQQQQQQQQQVLVASNTWSESKKENSEAGAPSWFAEPGKINTLWSEEWSNATKATGEAPGGSTASGSWAVSDKAPVADPNSQNSWTPEGSSTSNPNAATGQQNWEGNKLDVWSSPVGGEANGGPPNGISEKKELVGDIVVTPLFSQEMTPIDPKKVMYDPSPMEVDGVFTKSKMEIGSNGGSIKGNPLLSESSAIISQQQKIESAIIDPGKAAAYHNPLKYQPSSEGGLFQLFSNASASTADVQK